MQSGRVRELALQQRLMKVRGWLLGIAQHSLWLPLIMVDFGGDQKIEKSGVVAMREVNFSKEAWHSKERL